jgi:hypothetical protein
VIITSSDRHIFFFLYVFISFYFLISILVGIDRLCRGDDEEGDVNEFNSYGLVVLVGKKSTD